MNDPRPGTERFVELGLGADVLTLRSVADDDVVTSHTADIAELRHLLGHRPLDGMTVETLIAMVEDLVMSPLRDLPATESLLLAGDELAQVQGLLPSTDKNQAGISIETVEVLFNQLADRAAGSPSAWVHSTDAGTVVLGLVVLREVMHHGGFRMARVATGPVS